MGKRTLYRVLSTMWSKHREEYDLTLNDVAEKAYPLTRDHYGTNIKECIMTNLGTDTGRNPLVCKDAGVSRLRT